MEHDKEEELWGDNEISTIEDLNDGRRGELSECPVCFDYTLEVRNDGEFYEEECINESCGHYFSEEL